MALVKDLHLLCSRMTSLLDISTDIMGVILDTNWEIIPLTSTLRWALRDHLFLKPRHSLLTDHSLLSQAPAPSCRPTFCQQHLSYIACLWPFLGFTLIPVWEEGGLCRPPLLVVLGTILFMFPCVSFLGFCKNVLVYRLGCTCPSSVHTVCQVNTTIQD